MVSAQLFSFFSFSLKRVIWLNISCIWSQGMAAKAENADWC